MSKKRGTGEINNNNNLSGITYIKIVKIEYKKNTVNITKRDFLKHKTVKTNDKKRRFGVVMTPLSRKI